MTLRSDIQCTLGQFGAKCEVANLRVSPSKSEAMIRLKNGGLCLLGNKSHAGVFKYLGILFKSDSIVN